MLFDSALWTDEGVHQLAKEIQILQLEKYNMIYMAVSVWKLKFVVWKYLEISGMKDVLAEKKIAGPNVVNSVVEGSYD